MGKLARLASVKSTKSESFVYTPPEQAYGAVRILVKPNLGYAVKPPATVSLPVLASVLRGLRRASAGARILIVEGVTSDKSAHEVFAYHKVETILDDNMRLAGMDELTMRDYLNKSGNPIRFDKMTAPAYLAQFDCVISVGAFKKTMLHDKPLISASLKNLYGFFPPEKYHARNPNARGQLHIPSVPEVLQDIYFTIGNYIHGAVVDLTTKYVSPDERPDRSRGVSVPVGQVVWGDDMLAVDETACRLANEPVPDYIHAIRRVREKISNAEKDF